MAGHMDIDAVWSFGAAGFSGVVEKASASNLKRTWVNNGHARDWFGTDGEGRAFLDAATEVKNIWVPYGE
jgi:aldehyde dehydrogenase (NAD+)